jgi:hypothetical protein
MTEKWVKDMIHEALEGGGGITQAKGNDQKLIMALMSSKGSLRNVSLFHTYTIVSRTKIKFNKDLGATQFIQEVIDDKNRNFVFNGDFVEGEKVKTHVPRTLFLQDHDHGRRVGDDTRVDNTYVKKFLNHFLNFIFFLKGVTIETYIGREDFWYKGNGMIMNTMGRRESLGSGNDHLMFIEDGLEVLQNRGCLRFLYGMELGNNARMTFFEQLFHVMGNNDPW